MVYRKVKKMQQYQDDLIETTFGWLDKNRFLRKEKEATEVSTWDGRAYGFVGHPYLEKLSSQIGCLGPIAGLFGRDIEQEIMSMKTNYIPHIRFENSVCSSKLALRRSEMNIFIDDDE